jgi:hypothetical protein
MKMCLNFVVLLNLFISFSYADNITGERESLIVTSKSIDGEKFFGFDHCQLDRFNELIESSCKQIGSKEWYSHSELMKIKRWEKAEAYLKTAGAAVGIGVIAMAGGHIGVMASAPGLAGLGGGLLGMVLGTGTGVAAYTAISSSVEKINPVTQFKQGNVLSDELLFEDTVEEDKEILKIIGYLSAILD